jgi:predicted 3-demethylubiquinone-9 3-methyltransferase (glyoxalase superfamily)
MQKIVTYLWFDGRVEEALTFYTSVFADSKVLSVSHYGEAGPGRKGDVAVAELELAGQQLAILNGGPAFPLTFAVSLLINCEDQAEVDYYWERLSDGGEKLQCGWLTDRFGLSWQVVPVVLGRMMADTEGVKAERVTRAMLEMAKLDIAALERAYAGD